MLPHQFPFRLVDRLDGGRIVLVLSTNASWVRGADDLPRALGIEILAQAAMLLLPDGLGRERGLLAGIDRAEFQRGIRAGDRLTVEATALGGFGKVMKVEGRVTDEHGEPLVTASLLVARGE